MSILLKNMEKVRRVMSLSKNSGSLSLLKNAYRPPSRVNATISLGYTILLL